MTTASLKPRTESPNMDSLALEVYRTYDSNSNSSNNNNNNRKNINKNNSSNNDIKNTSSNHNDNKTCVGPSVADGILDLPGAWEGMAEWNIGIILEDYTVYRDYYRDPSPIPCKR